MPGLLWGFTITTWIITMDKPVIIGDATLHYLSAEEEVAIKNSIPWEDIDAGIRDLVSVANRIEGIATVQSCTGHIKQLEGGLFNVESAQITFKVTHNRLVELLFEAIPYSKVGDVEMRYFEDGTFWLCIRSDPAEKKKLYDVFDYLQRSIK